MKKYLLFIFISGLILSTNKSLNAATNVGDDPPAFSTKQKLKIADDLAAGGSYYNAIDYYKQYLEDEKDDVDVMFKLADSYRSARDYKNAETWYKKAFTSDKKENINAQYFYALMLKYNCKYDEAKTEFEKIGKGFKGDDASIVKKMAKEEAKGCEEGIKLVNDPLHLVVKHLGKNVNNPYSDFGPVAITNDRLLYSSIKSDTVVVVGGQERASYVSRIYEVKKGTKDWGKPKEFGDGNINSDEDHTGNGSISADGKLFFFSRCREVSATDLKLNCSIYVSSKDGEGWTRPEKLPAEVNAPNSNNTQPSAAKGTKGEIILYFVSDRVDGSAGGQDIWYTIYKKDGSCIAAQNLGKKINTAGDEVTPFYDNKEQTLYFSSNGGVTIGGFDIFKAKGSMKKLEDRVNVGYPINSCVDDRYFCHRPDHKGGFFVSNRAGGFELKSATCCDDIYQFDYIIIPVYAVKGFIYDATDKKKKNPLSLALITLTPDSVGKVTASDTTFKRNLQYFFSLKGNQSYKMHVTKSGYYAGNATCSTQGLVDSDTLKVDIFIKKIEKKKVRLEGIYYDFDKANLRPESDSALTNLLGILNENPGISVEIGSHTDNKGNDAYNMKLSQGRAQSVVDYLIAHGIDGKRLVAKGYGETQPDTINTNPDGSDCPVCRQKNRRTEFKIIGTIENTTIIYEQNGPSTIDSTGSTQQKLKDEAAGKGRAELNKDGSKTGEDPNKGSDAPKVEEKKETPSPAPTPAPKAGAKAKKDDNGDDASSGDDSGDDSGAKTAKPKTGTSGAKAPPKTTKPAPKKKGDVNED